MLLHMQAGRTYQRGKSAAYCLDGVTGLGTRSSLLHCFKEECRQEVGDLKEVFPIGSYVCSDCSNIVEEYPKCRGDATTRNAFLATQRPFQARVRALLHEQGPHFLGKVLPPSELLGDSQPYNASSRSSNGLQQRRGNSENRCLPEPSRKRHADILAFAECQNRFQLMRFDVREA